jgi:hypothetical protein
LSARESRIKVFMHDGQSNTFDQSNAKDLPPDTTGAARAMNIKAVHRDGQTFVTWMDVARGEAGAGYRYAVYRSEKPITQENLAAAEKRVWGIFNNSCKLYSFAFNGRMDVDRLDPQRPNCVIEAEGDPLPEGSGLAVITPERPGNRYYAVVATDLENNPLSEVIPGASATTEPVAEKPVPIQPIKVWDGKKREKKGSERFAPSGKRGFPLILDLHASGGYTHAGKNPRGDFYFYFGPREWGWREGLPGVFTVEEREGSLIVAPTDAIVRPPEGRRWMETFWMGYFCIPQWAEHEDLRVYPFGERRLAWVLEWATATYGADRHRIYCRGASMGASGTWVFGMARPEVFAAIYPNRGSIIAKNGMNVLVPSGPQAYRKRGRRRPSEGPAPMPDGKTDYWTQRDRLKYARDRHEDLPFIGWNCGRRDGFATWREHYDLVKTLTANHHGFAFAWNNGNHQGGKPLMKEHILKWYPPEKFALNLSYPAFSNSSIDNDMGNGDAADGDLAGGINLGFAWKDVVEKEDSWSATISNSLCKAEMTVDVTPRRCQEFKPTPGETCTWTNSAGGSGEVTTDEWGLVTVKSVTIKPGAETTVTLLRAARSETRANSPAATSTAGKMP